MVTQNKRLAIILFSAALVLLILFVAMQFTNSVNWSLADFITAAALLFGTGLISELIMRKIKTKRHRIIFCALLLVVLVLIWAELAVGIFGSSFAGS